MRRLDPCLHLFSHTAGQAARNEAAQCHPRHQDRGRADRRRRPRLWGIAAASLEDGAEAGTLAARDAGAEATAPAFAVTADRTGSGVT